MTKKVSVFAFLFLLSLLAVVPAFANGRNDPGAPVVYVTGQDLYYDSIIAAEKLPMKGPFQKLETDGGLHTEFGPGDPGYVGGRWWVDANGDGEMDEEDAFFLCPLLGPGRAEK